MQQTQLHQPKFTPLLPALRRLQVVCCSMSVCEDASRLVHRGVKLCEGARAFNLISTWERALRPASQATSFRAHCLSPSFPFHLPSQLYSASSRSMSAPAEEPTSPGAAAGDDAAARRAARKARILGAGGDRLARITKTGRGEEANTLYAAEEKKVAATRAASSAAPAPTPVANALAASLDDDPDDVDISTLRAPQQQQQATAQLPNIPGLDQLPPGMQDMFAQLQAAMGGAGGGADGSPFGGAEGMGAGFAPPPPAPASRLDGIFEVLRVVICAAFGLFLVAPLFKAHRAASISEEAPHLVHGGALLHWARLGYERPNPWDAGAFGLESLGFGGVVSHAESRCSSGMRACCEAKVLRAATDVPSLHAAAVLSLPHSRDCLAIDSHHAHEGE